MKNTQESNKYKKKITTNGIGAQPLGNTVRQQKNFLKCHMYFTGPVFTPQTSPFLIPNISAGADTFVILVSIIVFLVFIANIYIYKNVRRECALGVQAKSAICKQVVTFEGRI